MKDAKPMCTINTNVSVLINAIENSVKELKYIFSRIYKYFLTTSNLVSKISTTMDICGKKSGCHVNEIDNCRENAQLFTTW